MARNAEKAQAMLNRLVQARKDEARLNKEKRPTLASEVDDLSSCEKWRREVLKDIAKEVTNIQNGSLGEHKIRDMNDIINKFLREKRHWERQIKFLGGPDYQLTSPPILDADGRNAIGVDGYYYFGAARELPGVRELFERQIPEEKRRTRGELHQLIDADYYGYRDDDDGLLVKLEKKQEEKAIKESVKDWVEGAKKTKRLRYRALGMKDQDSDEEAEAPQISEETEELYKAHVPLPSEAEIEKLVLARRKAALLEKLAAMTEDQDDRPAATDNKESAPPAAAAASSS